VLRAYAEAQQLPSSDEVTGEIWKKLGPTSSAQRYGTKTG
jgi:hypothetical protein